MTNYCKIGYGILLYPTISENRIHLEDFTQLKLPFNSEKCTEKAAKISEEVEKV